MDAATSQTAQIRHHHPMAHHHLDRPASLSGSPDSSSLKRKRSPSDAHAVNTHAASALTSAAALPPQHGHPGHSNTLPPQQHPKQPKPQNHLQINYLARQLDDDLPLVHNDDTLPSILSLLGDYQGVLDRHESMACNLGARPLGPILIKRFERLFDGPPKVLKMHGREGTTVTWLDVVEFARNKPEQFQLGQMSEGVRVCQFYTKQCRVQISEEDYVLISSGIPQKMIPPQPIIEDEEKELGTIEILEKNLSTICHLADQVAARTRQLNHRLKGRKSAILDRRASEPTGAVRPSSPSNVALMNGGSSSSTDSAALARLAQAAQSPGFMAVNHQHQSEHNGPTRDEHHQTPGPNGASPATRSELLHKFTTVSDRHRIRDSISNGDPRSSPGLQAAMLAQQPIHRPSTSRSHTLPVQSQPPPYSTQDPLEGPLLHAASNPVAIPSTPQNLMSVQGGAVRPGHSQGQNPPASAEKDDGGPFKTEMVARMEALAKGERVMPPCDRCRRLHMDCLKNLTACMGCTKKHAKCAWRDVREGELLATAIGTPGVPSAGVDPRNRYEESDRVGSDQGLSDSDRPVHPADRIREGSSIRTTGTATPDLEARADALMRAQLENFNYGRSQDRERERERERDRDREIPPHGLPSMATAPPAAARAAHRTPEPVPALTREEALAVSRAAAAAAERQSQLQRDDERRREDERQRDMERERLATPHKEERNDDRNEDRMDVDIEVDERDREPSVPRATPRVEEKKGDVERERAPSVGHTPAPVPPTTAASHRPDVSAMVS